MILLLRLKVHPPYSKSQSFPGGLSAEDTLVGRPRRVPVRENVFYQIIWNDFAKEGAWIELWEVDCTSYPYH